MKKRFIKLTIFVVLILFINVSASCCVAAEISWLYDFNKAKEEALSEDKVIMAVVITEWDDASYNLINKVLNEDEIIKLSRRFINLQVSILNRDFVKRFNINAFPTTLFLKKEDGTFYELDRIIGCQKEDVFLSLMKNILENKDYKSKEKIVSSKEFDELTLNEKISILKDVAEDMEKQKRYYEAKDYLMRLVDIDKKNKEKIEKEIDYLRALVYFEQMKIGNAIDILEGLDTKKADFKLIECYLVDNDLDKAEALIQSYLERYPQDERAPFLLDTQANLYFRNNRIKKGIDTYLKIIKDYPDTEYAKNARQTIETMIAWPKRREELYIKREIQNKVVIVPDIKTYLYYISLWTDKKIYPVLIDGSYLNDRFIQEFNPKEVERVRSIMLPGAIDEALLLKTLFTSWQDDDLLTAINKKVTKEDIRQYLKDKGHIPLGIVLTRVNDGQMPAAVALASARDQILDFLPFTSKGEKIVSFDKMQSLKSKIEGIIKRWHYPYLGLLDGIDYITIAGDFPYAYNYQKTPLKGRYSLDDALARDDKQNRYAYCGRIIGNWDMSIYQAMCSLFLQPKDALFFNTYSHSGNWKDYRTDLASHMLSDILDVTNIENKAASLERWQILNKEKGNIYGLLFINSSGGAYDWQTSTDKAKVDDIPESEPCIVIFTHSNSAADPYDENTIAGRWLKNGAYIYFGSISEPYVQSFKTPSEVVVDLLFGRPFSQSLMKDSGLWSNPWKLIFIGDPMYSLLPYRMKSVDNTISGELEQEKKGL